MADVQTFRRRPAEVQAVRWTGDNAAEMEAFAGLNFEVLTRPDLTDDPDATAAVLDGEHSTWKLLLNGDWVTRDADGQFHRMRAAEFDAAYEPHQEAPDRQPESYERGVRDGWHHAGLFVREDPAAIRAYAAQAGFDLLTDAQAEFVGRIVVRIRMGLQYAAQDGSVAELTGQGETDVRHG